MNFLPHPAPSSNTVRPSITSLFLANHAPRPMAESKIEPPMPAFTVSRTRVQHISSATKYRSSPALVVVGSRRPVGEAENDTDCSRSSEHPKVVLSLYIHTKPVITSALGQKLGIPFAPELATSTPAPPRSLREPRQNASQLAAETC